MVRMVGVEIVRQQRPVGSVDRVQVAGPPHTFREARLQHHAEVVDEDRLAGFGQLQRGRAGLPKGERRRGGGGRRTQGKDIALRIIAVVSDLPGMPERGHCLLWLDGGRRTRRFVPEFANLLGVTTGAQT